jgi:hypothetical protein
VLMRNGTARSRASRLFLESVTRVPGRCLTSAPPHVEIMSAQLGEVLWAGRVLLHWSWIG